MSLLAKVKSTIPILLIAVVQKKIVVDVVVLLFHPL
jgi:hypothetical protein